MTKMYIEEQAFFTDTDWRRAQKVLEEQAMQAQRRIMLEKEAALLRITVAELEHMHMLDNHPLMQKYTLIGYVDQGGKITRPLGHGNVSFMHVYQYALGARFAVAREIDSREEWPFVLMNLWDTPSSYTTLKGGRLIKYDEPLLLDTNVMRFPHEDAAMAAAVIKAHHVIT
jgi:hypothetical protein